MKKKVFWIGLGILVVGVVVFGYSDYFIDNINSMYAQPSDAFLIHPNLKGQWDMAHMLQPIGLGLLALGAIMLAYGVFVKK